jgi:hypothetical protein
VLLCLSFAVRLSRASVQLKTLGQEVALLRASLGELSVSQASVDREGD